MRPLYETGSDLAKEASFAEKIEKQWGCELKKLPIKYGVDFMATRNNQLAWWVEIKCRNTRSDQHAEYMLSVEKWLTGKRLSEGTGAPFVLAVRFLNTDKFLIVHDSTQIRYGFGGRTVQARDEQDAEPVVYIPMEFFKDV